MYFSLPDTRFTLPAGAIVRRRHSDDAFVHYLEEGCVVFGIYEGGCIHHQVGVFQGPVWLDVAAAVLQRCSLADMVARTPVVMRRAPLEQFCASCEALPDGLRNLLHDMAMVQYQQIEKALACISQDASARCANWLLHHAEHGTDGRVRVILRQSKKLIAAQLGIAPETLSRILRSLRECGAVAGTGRVLDLLLPAKLQEMAGLQPA